MSNLIQVYIESGIKKTFATAIDWPGLSRCGKNEESALQTLYKYCDRYKVIIKNAGISFSVPPSNPFHIIDHIPGSASTDFGVPEAKFEEDKKPLNAEELSALTNVLNACTSPSSALERSMYKGPVGLPKLSTSYCTKFNT